VEAFVLDKQANVVPRPNVTHIGEHVAMAAVVTVGLTWMTLWVADRQDFVSQHGRDQLPFRTLEPSDVSKVLLPRWKPGQGMNFHPQEQTGGALDPGHIIGPADSAHLLLVSKENHLNFGQNVFDVLRRHGELSWAVGIGKRDAPTLSVSASDRLHYLPDQHRHIDEVDIGSDRNRRIHYKGPHCQDNISADF